MYKARIFAPSFTFPYLAMDMQWAVESQVELTNRHLASAGITPDQWFMVELQTLQALPSAGECLRIAICLQAHK